MTPSTRRLVIALALTVIAIVVVLLLMPTRPEPQQAQRTTPTTTETRQDQQPPQEPESSTDEQTRRERAPRPQSAPAQEQAQQPPQPEPTQQTPAPHQRAVADVGAVRAQLEEYKSRTGTYPTTGQGLRVLEGGAAPKDAWGRDYIYEFPSTRGRESFDLFSAGPDGSPDTPDDDWGEEGEEEIPTAQ